MSDNMTRLLALELLDGDTESNVWMTREVHWRDVRNAHRHVVDRLTRERDSAREAVRELTRERDEARETIKALNRRCQSAESGLAHALDAAGDRTFGRALANCAASMYREQNRELVEALRPFGGCITEPMRDPPDPNCCRYCKARALVEKYGGSRD